MFIFKNRTVPNAPWNKGKLTGQTHRYCQSMCGRYEPSYISMGALEISRSSILLSIASCVAVIW